MRGVAGVLGLLLAFSASAARVDDLRAAQALLWKKRYAEAARIYRGILDKTPDDVDARKGLATAEYWSGDFRAARRDYAAVVRARPRDAEARKALADIEATMRPLFATDDDVVSDDQPLRRAKASAGYTFFSDPLTKWIATAGTYLLEARSLGFGSATAPFAAIAGSTVLPSARLRAGGSLRVFRFPDGETKPLGGVTLGRGNVTLDLDRHELLYTATSLRAHASETTATLGWSRSSDASSSAAALHAVRYFDGNSGRAADAYHLARIAQSPISVGASVAVRDSDESRFHLVGASAAPLPDGGFAYSYAARYDPYWTPRNLREARAIVAATLNAGRTTLHLHADGGVGRDDDLLFGPSSGATAAVPLFPAPIEVARTFHPWRVSADAVVPLRGAVTASIGVERQTTVFYRADAIHFGLSGRL